MIASVVVIGSGPAGLMAACFAAQTGAHVTLIDSNDRIGRKLLVTGAGRCNLSNVNVAAVRYACDNPVWLNQVLLQFPREDLLAYLDLIGIPSFSTFDGWYYPISESAHAVADAFDAELDNLGVVKTMKRMVTGIQPVEGGFDVQLHRETLHFERVVIACGGKAYPALGSDGSLFDVIRALGHQVHPIHPALAPITTDMRGLQGLSGVRLDAEVSLKQADVTLGRTLGNIIFTQWGVNGPGVMDLSYLVNVFSPKEMTLELNLLHQHETWIQKVLSGDSPTDLTLKVLLQAILPPKLAVYLIHRESLNPDVKVSEITASQRKALMENLTRFTLTVTGTRGFEYSQVSTGGVPVKEVSPLTMESIIHPGLHFAGEVLDVVGPCGGYNLHFAFTTGAIAGKSAAML